LYDKTLRNQRFHIIFCVTPITCNAHDFILGIAFRRISWRSHANKLIFSTCAWLYVLVEIFNIFFGVRAVLCVKQISIIFCIYKNSVTISIKKSTPLTSISFNGRRSFPSYIIYEIFPAKHFI
jgi:hypothetical protein